MKWYSQFNATLFKDRYVVRGVALHLEKMCFMCTYICMYVCTKISYYQLWEYTCFAAMK